MTEGKHKEALHIALEGGVVERCQIHKDVLYDSGDPSGAYKIASAKWRDHELLEHWESLRVLTDAIKDIVDNETALDVCPSCESF